MKLPLFATMALLIAAVPVGALPTAAASSLCVEGGTLGDPASDCLVESTTMPASEPAAACIPTSGGMDYHSFLCIDASNPKCAVYTETSSDAGIRRRCYGLR